MSTISIANQKGGLGKTTTAMNLSAGLKQKGFKVLAIDFDYQSNLSKYLGHISDGNPTTYDIMFSAISQQAFDVTTVVRENKEGIFYIPSNARLAGMENALAAIPFREKILSNFLNHEYFQAFDYIVIDNGPALGTLLSNALSISDSVIIPVQPHPFALDGLAQLESVINVVKVNMNNKLQVGGVFITMFDNTIMTKAVHAELENRYGDLLLKTHISKSVAAPESVAKQESLVAGKNKLGEEYIALLEELLERGM